MADKKLILPQSLKIVDSDGNPTIELMKFLTDLTRIANDLSARVKALENK